MHRFYLSDCNVAASIQNSMEKVVMLLNEQNLMPGLKSYNVNFELRSRRVESRK